MRAAPQSSDSPAAAAASPTPAASAGAAAGPAPRRSCRERYRLLRSKWNEEWWSIALGGPIGNVLNALIADVPWITPNALTWLGFLCKLVGGPLLLVRTPTADVAGIALLQLNVVFDCMDGSLARYRRRSSAYGSFLDKVTDLVGLHCVMAVAGWRVYLDSGDALPIAVALLCAASLAVRGYVYWVVAHLERDGKVAQPTVGKDQRRDFSTLSVGERFRLYLRSMPLVLRFAESDLYFWIGLGVLLGRLRETIYVLGVVLGIAFVLTLSTRLRAVLRLDDQRAR